MLNRTRSKHILTSSTDSSFPSKLNRFTVVQRSAFILSFVSLTVNHRQINKSLFVNLLDRSVLDYLSIDLFVYTSDSSTCEAF